MTISYPLAFPTHTKRKTIMIRAKNTVGLSVNPYNLSQQTYRWPGEGWEADIVIPPMSRADAETWIAWLLSLRGHHGTFTMGFPLLGTARGEAGGTPIVNGADQTGDTLTISGATISQTGWLKAGDCIQIGTGSSARIKKVLADVDADGAGEATIDVWPRIRTAPEDTSAVVVSNPVGVWRLSSNETAWSVDNAEIYGLSFGAIEAI